MCVLISVGISDFMDIDSPRATAHCPKCGAERIHINATGKDFIADPDIFITCDDCHYQGALAKTLQEALVSWKRPLDMFVVRLENLTRKWGVQ